MVVDLPRASTGCLVADFIGPRAEPRHPPWLCCRFFLFELPKVLMLLTLVVFGVGIVRSFFTPERTRAILAGRRESAGNVMAALLGVVTPFCSCSAVPLFIGFVTTGVPLGVTFSFLISAPISCRTWRPRTARIKMFASRRIISTRVPFSAPAQGFKLVYQFFLIDIRQRL